MSLAEYQLSLKHLIDATTDETVLKRWKTLLEADLEHGGKKSSAGTGDSSLNEPVQESKGDKKDDTSDYVLIESGLGIDE